MIRFCLDEAATVTELGRGWACKNASFTLDSDLKLEPTDCLILEDGLWYLVRNNIKVHIEGKWDR